MAELEVSSLCSQRLPTNEIVSAVFCANVNSFLLLTKTNQVFVLDASCQKQPVGPIELCGNDGNRIQDLVQMYYDPEYGSLVLRNKDAIGIRRDLHGCYLLRTALVPKSSNLVDIESDTDVEIELTTFEAEKLLEYLQQVLPDNPDLEKFYNELNAQLKLNADADGLSSDKWCSAVIGINLSQIHLSVTKLLADLRLKPTSALPVVAALKERLNLFKAEPYNFELGLDGNGLDKSVMSSEAARQMTFEHWPHMHYKWALPGQMAEAGFYHQPNTTGDDRVMCFTCNVCLVCWEPSDEPWSEHERHSPQCPFVRGECTHNVPICVTYGSLPAMTHGVSDSQVTVGSTSHCEWLPTVTIRGHIQIWHLDRVYQIPQDFHIDLTDPYIGMKTGYLQEPRRVQKVTWSDDACEPSELSADTEPELIEQIEIDQTVNEPDQSFTSSPSLNDMKVTAVCCCNRSAAKQNILENDNSWETTTSACSPALVVGLSLDDRRLRTASMAWMAPRSEVDALNSVNRAVPSTILSTVDDKSVPYRPFLLVYKIDRGNSKSDDDQPLTKPMTKKPRGNQELKSQLFAGQSMPYGGTIDEVQSLSDIEEELLAFPPDDDAWGEENNNGDLSAAINSAINLPPQVAAAPPDFGGFGTGSKHSNQHANQQHDLLQLQYEPPTASLLVLQCFRLPSMLDVPGYIIEMILPSVDGFNLAVFINVGQDCANSGEADAFPCAVVLYKLSFTGLMTGIQELPLREHYFRQLKSGIKQVVLLPAEFGNREPTGPDRLDLAAMLLNDGSLVIVDLDSGKNVYTSEETFVRIVPANGNCIGLINNDGEFELVQVNAHSFQSEDSFENHLLAAVKNPTEAHKIIDTELPLTEPMSTESLSRVWELTRSDSAASITNERITAAATTSCWNEVQQHQRLRKNPQHYLREEKLTKTWHLIPDGNSWKEHLFEIMLPNVFRCSHIDLRFVLNWSCIGLPDIEISLLRKCNRSTDTEFFESSSRKHKSKTTSLQSLDQAQLVAGPYRLSDATELTDSTGLIQLASPVLQSDQNRNFFIHIKAISEESESQKLWKITQEKLREVGTDKIVKSSKLQTQSRPNMSAMIPKLINQSPAFGKPNTPLLHGSSAKLPISVETKRMEDRKGCDWIEELSITVWKAKKLNLPRERLCRMQVLYSCKLHTELVRLLATTDESKTTAEIFYCQNLALDILLWISDHDISTLLLNMRQAFLDNLDLILTNCFANSTRSVAHKCCALFCQIICSLRWQYADAYSDFIERLSSTLSGTLTLLPAFQSAGSLTWFFSLVSRLFRIDPINCQQLHNDCLNLLVHLGHELSRRHDRYHQKLLSRFGLSGLPLELELFDWPQQVFALMPRGTQQFTYANVAGPGATSVTGHFLTEITQDEMDCGDFLNVDFAESANNISSFGNRKPRRRWLLSREHLHGMLEVEPLGFTCHSASDGMRVEVLETGISCQIGSGPLCSGLGPGPIPLPDVAQADGVPGNPAMAHVVSSMNQQVQSILSKQMQLLALQQQRQKLQGQLQEHSATVEASVTPATQGSSASTFGVPTTPKTTPFMTPTPLSPSQLSPINSEADLPQLEKSDSGQDVMSAERKMVSLMPQDLLKPPSHQALHIDRMNSGMRKFVVLDFGRPVFLTDLVIPSCGDLGSICIDVWLQGESNDGQRLVVSNEISHKTLAVSDLQPPAFCRYLKITYIGRHGMGSCSCKITLGAFYGYRFIKDWQLHMWAKDISPADRMAALQSPVSIRHLRQLAEDLRCRHHLAAAQLQQLLDEFSSDETGIRELYRQCVQMRDQWNLVRSVVARMEWDRRALARADLSPNWNRCGVDQLRNTAHQLLGCLIRSAPIFHSDPVCGESMNYFLEFDSALTLFQQFCASGSPLLQAYCSIFLFQHGCSTSWWGEFFAVLLKKMFGCGTQADERIFLLLSFLCGQSIKSGASSVVTELLKLVDSILDQSQKKTVDASLLSWTLMLLSSCFDVASGGRKKIDRWSFLTGEFGFTAVGSGLDDDRKMDGPRQKSRKTIAPHAKPATKVKWLETGVDLMEQQYQKSLLLYEDIKNYVGSKPGSSLKSKKSEASSSKSTSKPASRKGRHSRSRQKGRGIRLKLPHSLCLSVAHKLALYLTESKGELTYPANLVACKVISKTCSISTIPIFLLQIANELRLQKLLSLAMDSRQSSWMRHAVLCLILDILDAEQRAQRTPSVKLVASASAGIAGVQPFSDATEGVSEIACADSETEISSSVTVLNPDTPKDAQQAVETALANVKPIDVPGCQLDAQLRTKQLKVLCKEVIHTHLNAGEPFARIDNWVSSVKQTEKGLASTSQTSHQYKVRVQKFLSLQSGSGNQYLIDLLQDGFGGGAGAWGNAAPWSPSSANWSFAVPPLSVYSVPPPPLGVSVLSSSSPVVVTASSSSTKPKQTSSSENPGPGYAAAKEKLSKLCEQIQMSNSPMSPMTFMAGSTPPPMMTGDAFVLDFPLDNMPVGDDASGSAESGQSPTQTEADESVCSSVADLSSNASFAEMTESHRELLIDIDIRRNISQMQPVSPCLDERAESQLGCRAMNECQRWLIGDDTLLRLALRSCTCPKRPISKVVTETAVPTPLPSSLDTLCSVLSSLFAGLTPKTNCDYVERLLTLFAEISTGVSKHKRTLVTGAVILLSQEAIASLTEFLLYAPILSEHVWILAFKVLQTITETKVDQDSHLANFLNDKRFLALLERFLKESNGKYCQSSTAGPVIVNAFGDFLNRLYQKAALEHRLVLCEIVSKLLTLSLQNCDSPGYGSVPVDILIKVVESLRTWWLDCRGCRLMSVDTIAGFIRVTCNVAHSFLSCSSRASQEVSVGVTYPNVCFQHASTNDISGNEKENGGTNSKSNVDRFETLICNLLSECARFTDTTIADETTYADCLVLKEPAAVQDLFSALTMCQSNITSLQSVPCWTPVSVGDWVIHLVESISLHVTQVDSFLELVVKYLSTCTTDSYGQLSFPLVWTLTKVLDSQSRLVILGRLGGFRVVADQLLQSIHVVSVETESQQSKVLRRLASISNQVMGFETGDISGRRPSDIKVDGMSNFAPICQIQSGSPMAHHLNSLLASTPPHRRARTAAWSYHFYPAELWLDMTLTLPYPVLLQEIQIRPHAPTLNTGPGAVQVELGSDSNSSALTVLGPPIITTGYNRIRISAAAFGYPVQVVKLHLRRPPDSTNLGLSQILLLGYSPTTKIASGPGNKPDLVHWLALLGHLLTSKDFSTFSDQRPQLANLLVSLFLQQPLDSSFYKTLTKVIKLLSESQPTCVVAQILQQITRTGDIKEECLPWISELIYSFCTQKDQDTLKPLSELMHFVSRIASGRVMGSSVVNDTVASYCFWLTACIVWANHDKFESKVSTNLYKVLCALAIDQHYDSQLRQSVCWLLCSLCRSDKSFLELVLGELELDNVTTNSNSIVLLGQIGMSKPTAEHLISSGLLSKLANQLKEKSSQLASGTDDNADLVLCLTKLFSDLSQIDVVKQWLSTSDGCSFFPPLIQTLVGRRAVRNVVFNWAALEHMTIHLIQQCLVCHLQHQQRFSDILCQILRECDSGLSSALQQIILCTLLDDERVPVLLDNSSPHLITSPTVPFTHPCFGCSRQRSLRYLSVFAECRDILTSFGTNEPPKVEKKVSYAADMAGTGLGSMYDQMSYASFSASAGPGSAFTDFFNQTGGEKHKLLAGRIAKSSNKRSRNENKDTLRIFSDELSMDKILPARLMVGQLYLEANERSFNSHGLVFIQLRTGETSEFTVENKSLLELPKPDSVLGMFARKGGLALLAQHLQLYQPSFAIQPKRNRPGYYSEKELQYIDQTEGGGFGGGGAGFGAFSASTALAGDYDYDFEFIDGPNGTPWASNNFATTVPQANSANRILSVTNCGLSPHVVVAFSVFLRLDGYAELLVTQDRHRAQRLLRLAMGVNTDAGQSLERTKSTDTDALSLLSFSVLEKLYQMHTTDVIDGRSLRKASLDLGILDILLVCLSTFSHQSPRETTLRDGSPLEPVFLVEQLLQTMATPELSTVSSANLPTTRPTGTGDRAQQYWAKGTGFGTGSTQQQWNVDLHMIKRKQDEETVTCLLKVLASFIYTAGPVVSGTDVESSAVEPEAILRILCPAEDLLPSSCLPILKRSCLVETLASYLRNDSVLDISRHVQVYQSVLEIISSVAQCKPVSDLLVEKDSHHRSLRAILFKFKQCIQVYLSKLNKEQNAGEPQSDLLQTPVSEESMQPTANQIAEEGLLKLVPLIEQTTDFVAQNVDEDVTDGTRSADSGLSASVVSFEDQYITAMKNLQYESVQFFDSTGTMIVPYHYESSVMAAKETGTSRAPRTRRLAQEAVTLSSSLPLSASSSVFVRASEERLDVMKVLIMGPDETPYAGGCFEFDVWFPTDYPNSPMHVTLQTTGGHTIRFNPNLYNDGKVCLSVLNTWHGRPEERWNAQTSSFLQVIVSIQSLILVTDPYFNEPGYERSRGTPAGQQASREYDANIEQATVRWAMLEMLRKPSSVFKDVIERHFWLKRDEICKQIERWIADSEKASEEQRGARTISNHLSALKRHFQALKDEFKKLQCPDGLELTEVKKDQQNTGENRSDYQI